jgi:hypothetical protein
MVRVQPEDKLGCAATSGAVEELVFDRGHSGVLTKEVTGALFSPSCLGRSLLMFGFPVEGFNIQNSAV